MHIVPYHPQMYAEARKKAEHALNILTRYTVEDLKDWKKVDFYFLFNIEFLRHTKIEPSVLLFVYKKQVMKYHPDRGEYPKEIFLLLQRAFKILSEPVLRKRYDSLQLDESIPEDRIYEMDEFLETFGPVFERNGAFSEIQPFPEIGTVDSTETEIGNFYNFWLEFQSWRTFEMLFEDDYEKSNSDRRAAEKENKAKVLKMKIAEAHRIKKLVDIALKRDPRINKNKTKIDKKHVCGGWSESEVELLTKLLADIKVGQKNRFDQISKKFNGTFSKKRDPKEIFLKCNQMNKQ